MRRSDFYMHQPAFYDLFNVDHPKTILRQKFFQKYTKGYSEILELGAGTGNIALFLADNGLKVTCVEPSPTVVNTLCSKIFNTTKYDNLLTIIPQTAEAFQSKKRYRCIIAPSLLHLIENEGKRRKIYQSINRLLLPGGKLIITFFPESLAVSKAKIMDGERRIGDSIYKRYTEYKTVRGVKPYSLVNVIWTFEIFRERKLVEKFKEQFRCRCDSLNDVYKQLKRFGFLMEQKFSDYSEMPFHEKQQNSGMILICKKG